MSEEKLDLYYVEPREGEPIIYLEKDSVELFKSYDGGFFQNPVENTFFFPDPDRAIEHFKANTLAQIAQLRAEADFLMDNLKSIQPMEDL